MVLITGTVVLIVVTFLHCSYSSWKHLVLSHLGAILSVTLVFHVIQVCGEGEVVSPSLVAPSDCCTPP